MFSRSIRDALAIPARGLLVSTRTLKDGFAIRARRTCGPVPSDLVYAGAKPTFTWGAGFSSRGPFGYAKRSAVPASEMFMGSTATLVLEPTTCDPRPLIFRATLETAGPATIVSTYREHTQRLYITSLASLVIETPKSRSPVRIHFQTDAPVADWDPIYFRYERDRPRDLRLRFFAPSVAEGAATRGRRRTRKRC